MKSIRPLYGIVLGIALSSCKTTPPKAPEEAIGDSVDRQRVEAVARYGEAIATQDRVNRYFHRKVLPGLKRCWAALESEGTIAVRVAYRRNNDLWTASDSGIRSSTVAKEQEALALRCLAQATADTSFAAEKADGDAEEFVVNWTLPVPWPADLKEVAARMAIDQGGGGSGGCGGPETPPACQDCAIISLFGFSLCVPTCTGFIDCTPEADGNGCRMKTKCVTVTVFGNRSGFVRY